MYVPFLAGVYALIYHTCNRRYFTEAISDRHHIKPEADRRRVCHRYCTWGKFNNSVSECVAEYRQLLKLQVRWRPVDTESLGRRIRLRNYTIDFCILRRHFISRNRSLVIRIITLGTRDYYKKNFRLHIYGESRARDYSGGLGVTGGAPAGSMGRAPGQEISPEAEGVLAFGCQKEVAKLRYFSVFC